MIAHWRIYCALAEASHTVSISDRRTYRLTDRNWQGLQACLAREIHGSGYWDYRRKAMLYALLATLRRQP